MTRRTKVTITLTFSLALSAACGLWFESWRHAPSHRERVQTELNAHQEAIQLFDTHYHHVWPREIRAHHVEQGAKLTEQLGALESPMGFMIPGAIIGFIVGLIIMVEIFAPQALRPDWRGQSPWTQQSTRRSRGSGGANDYPPDTDNADDYNQHAPPPHHYFPRF
jgi:hypothetical protein